MHHVYLIPGLFGFGKLAGYDYFEHVERALEARFEAAGERLRCTVVSAPPTASIPYRASMLAQEVGRSPPEPGARVHLIGHSTGGLDARILLAPSVRLPLPPGALAWTRQVRSVVSVNTPHFGTPLAAYFTTVAGTRVLYLLSLLTVASLSVGRLPLSLFSAVIGAINNLDDRFGVQIRVLDELTAQVLRFVGDQARGQISDYLKHVKDDQGGIVQLMPEVMELFNATVVDHPGVRYGCIATAAPAPGPRRALSMVTSPIGALHLAVYTLVYGFASRAAARYPYAEPDPWQREKLEVAFAEGLRSRNVDGIVPTLSMLWGELVWCGVADHLDIVGHFGDFDEQPRRHVDWLRSGAGFGTRDFDAMTDALAAFLLRA
ncbi:MAG: hypothetical protein ABW252_22225 [Polyangiales bacterium]